MKFTEHVKEEVQINFKNLFYILLKRKDYKSFYSYIWSRACVQNVGPGLPHFLYRRFPQIVPYPREIEVEVTTRCHLKCRHCEHTYWNEENKDRSFEEFKYIVDQFPDLKWINTTGEGTAFLNKDFIKILKYIKSKGIFVKFVESFDRFKINEMEDIIKLGVERIICSMEGATKKTYEEIRVGASFDRVINNLIMFHELKKKMNSPLPEISFRYVLMRNNYHEFPDFMRLVKKLGVGNSINVVDTLDFKEIRDLSIQSNKNYLKELARIANENQLDIPFGPTITRRPITMCTAWTQPYIMMGGYVLPCCAVLMSNRRDFLRKHAFGNILEKPFKEIWYSPEYVSFRLSVPRKKGPLHPFCVDCRAFDTLERSVSRSPQV